MTATADRPTEGYTFTDRATLSLLIAYEDGDLSNADTLRLFGRLVRTGLAWTLQGAYGRAAHALIATGWLDEDGTPNPALMASLCQEAGCKVEGHHLHAPACKRRALGWQVATPEPSPGTYAERVETEGGPQ